MKAWILCDCGCGVRIPARTANGTRRRWASPKCRKRWQNRQPKYRDAKLAHLHARRAEVRGRLCRWCNRSDAETRWSGNDHECARCDRAKRRQQCSGCGGPWWARFGCLKCPVGTPPRDARRYGREAELTACPSCGKRMQRGSVTYHRKYVCPVVGKRGWCSPQAGRRRIQRYEKPRALRVRCHRCGKSMRAGSLARHVADSCVRPERAGV